MSIMKCSIQKWIKVDECGLKKVNQLFIKKGKKMFYQTIPYA